MTSNWTRVAELLSEYEDKKISLAQFRARMKDLGYDDEDIDEFLDGEEGDAE